MQVHTTLTEIEMMRAHLLEMLTGQPAHVDFDTAIKGLPARLRGAKPPGSPHTPWRLLEHIRISQWDILDFCVNPNYSMVNWPDDFWPEKDAPPDDKAWDASVRAFHHDRQALKDLVADSANDLLRPIPHGEGQTILREIMLVVDHTAYHVGQLVLVRRLLGAWDKE